MTRKLKAIALALTAIFAMSALAASSAHATLTSSSSHTILTGSQESSMTFTVGAGFGAISCATVTFEGTAASTTVESMVVTPKVSTCKDSLGRIAHVENALSGNITEEGQVHVSGSSTVKITSSGGSVVCTFVVKTPQTVNGSTSENLGGTNGVKVAINTTNAVTTTSGGFFGCGISDGEHKSGTIQGTVRVKGQDTSGTPASISVE